MTGSIKTKTPKFKFIIPQFNIATWHDYIEDNFRSIDALFYNLFDIQNFKGSWTKTTEYKKDQVLFIPEDYEVDENGQLKKDEQGELIVSECSGRMVKVLKDHTTNNSDYFSLYYFNHKDEYELFADASTAQKFANLSKQYSENAQQFENKAELYKNNAQSYAQEAENSKNLAQQNAQLATNKAESATTSATNAKNSENSANNSATLAEGYKNDAKSSADSAKSSENITTKNVQTVTSLIQDANLVAVGTDLRSASSNIKNVSSISEQTKNVSNNMSYIKSVDNNKVNINKTVTNETNITTVAENIDNVNIIAQNKNNIDTVVSNKDAIITTSTNISAINNVSENMADVKNAVQSANDAKLWAVGTITEKPEGSSKYWAEQAQQTVQVYDASETVKGIVRLATSEEVKAGTNDSAVITPLKFKQKIVQDLSTPSADTVPSTQAVLSESSRIESIMDTKVDKSGDTMTGPLSIVNEASSTFLLNKSSRSTGALVIQNTDDDITQIATPLSGCTREINITDKNGYVLAKIRAQSTRTGNRSLEFYAYNKIDNNNNTCFLKLIVDKNGNVSTQAPSCSLSGSILTTQTKGDYSVRLGNGMQISWGVSNTTTNLKRTITLPQPFANINYAVITQITAWQDTFNSGYTSCLVTNAYTTTNFTASSNADVAFWWIAIGNWK